MECLLNASNPVFGAYAFYGSIVILKMFALALMTSMKRGETGVFANTEDAQFFYTGQEKDKSKRVIFDNSKVERVRRNHLNDLENIPAFLVLGLIYVTIEPTLSTALWHFRIFVISRVLHMIVYQLQFPQPSRGIIFLFGFLANMSMAVQII
ncbi:hypothetical protein CAPTEDRAFT_163793, partial [Capitella teleta]